MYSTQSLLIATMFKCTPGLLFIVHAVSRISFVLASLFLALFVFEKTTGHTFSLLYRCITYIGAIPVLLVGRRYLGVIRRRREMVEMGAVNVPVWRGKWPGNFDLLVYMKDQFDND